MFGDVFKLREKKIAKISSIVRDLRDRVTMFKRERMKEKDCTSQKKITDGLSRDLNPGPPAPKAGIIPLDH